MCVLMVPEVVIAKVRKIVVSITLLIWVLYLLILKFSRALRAFDVSRCAPLLMLVEFWGSTNVTSKIMFFCSSVAW